MGGEKKNDKELQQQKEQTCTNFQHAVLVLASAATPSFFAWIAVLICNSALLACSYYVQPWGRQPKVRGQGTQRNWESPCFATHHLLTLPCPNSQPSARTPTLAQERVVFLKVGLRPEISNQYNNLVSIINGETLQLHCVTQPNQRAQISWTLPNGMVLDAPQAVGRFSLLENGSLTVREASVFDRGTYLCKVSTEYGTSVMNVPVIVIAYPPRITSEPAPVIYARPGNSVKLNCMAIGIPKAEITWELPDKSHLMTGAQSRLYGNKFLHPQGSLVIQQSTQRDAGFYKCTAKNILGSDSKTTYIHIF